MHESTLHNGLNPSKQQDENNTTAGSNRGKTGENNNGRDLLEGLDTILTGSMAWTRLGRT